MDVEVWECEECGRRHFKHRRVCPACGGRSLRPRTVAGNGTVYSSTLIRVAPGTFADEAPYWIVLVDLDGVRVEGRLTGLSSEPSIGSTVKLRTAGEYLEFEVTE
jgi:uncharacterized OB-fold protein